MKYILNYIESYKIDNEETDFDKRKYIDKLFKDKYDALLQIKKFISNKNMGHQIIQYISPHLLFVSSKILESKYNF